MWVTGQGAKARATEPGEGGTARGAEAPAAAGHLGAGPCWRLLEVTGLLLKKKKDLFTLIIWLRRGSAAACGIFHCSVWDLVPCRGPHLGPPSLGAQS